MSIMQMLFSFQGRMRRRDYWLCFIGLLCVSMVLNFIIGMAMGPAVTVTNGSTTVVNAGMMNGLFGAYAIIGLIMLWPSLAIAIKRCHDRDQTGLWVLIMLVPLIGFFWWLINLGILDGTPGPNKYGPSPKGLGDVAAAPAA